MDLIMMLLHSVNALILTVQTDYIGDKKLQQLMTMPGQRPDCADYIKLQKFSIVLRYCLFIVDIKWHLGKDCGKDPDLA